MREPHDRPVRVVTWLKSAFAVALMAPAFAYGLSVIVGGFAHLPDAIRRGDVPSALGVMLLITMCLALFSIGAGLWTRTHSPQSASAAAWQRVFTVASMSAIGLMLLILTASIVPRL